MTSGAVTASAPSPSDSAGACDNAASSHVSVGEIHARTQCTRSASAVNGLSITPIDVGGSDGAAAANTTKPAAHDDNMRRRNCRAWRWRSCCSKENAVLRSLTAIPFLLPRRDRTRPQPTARAVRPACYPCSGHLAAEAWPCSGGREICSYGVHRLRECHIPDPMKSRQDRIVGRAAT